MGPSPDDPMITPAPILVGLVVGDTVGAVGDDVGLAVGLPVVG